MKTRVFLIFAVTLFSLLVLPTWAGKGDMRVQFGLLNGMPMDDLQEAGETIEADDAFGFQASFEYMITDTIGVEPGLCFSNHDIEVSGAGIPEFTLGDMDFRALTGNVNFYVMQKDKADLYLGPTIGYVFWGDLKTDFFGAPVSIAAEDEFAYGANLGVDVPLGESKWAFSAGLTYLFTEVTLENAGVQSPSALGVDPLNVRVGASYRF